MSPHDHADHSHAGHSHGVVGPDTDARRLKIGLALIVAFMVGEVIAGILADSLALLSDAAHMLTDAGALLLSLIVLRHVRRPARGNLTFLQLTFGYLLGRILVAWWLLPGYFTGQQETAYTRLESRFGPGTRRLLSACFLITRFLGDGVRIFAGAIPLVVAGGPGSAARSSIGVVVIFGVAFSTVLSLFVVPSFYALLAPHTDSPEALAHEIDLLEAQTPEAAGRA